jgi:hypothetical protein
VQDGSCRPIGLAASVAIGKSKAAHSRSIAAMRESSSECDAYWPDSTLKQASSSQWDGSAGWEEEGDWHVNNSRPKAASSWQCWVATAYRAVFNSKRMTRKNRTPYQIPQGNLRNQQKSANRFSSPPMASRLLFIELSWANQLVGWEAAHALFA